MPCRRSDAADQPVHPGAGRIRCAAVQGPADFDGKAAAVERRRFKTAVQPTACPHSSPGYSHGPGPGRQGCNRGGSCVEGRAPAHGLLVEQRSATSGSDGASRAAQADAATVERHPRCRPRSFQRAAQCCRSRHSRAGSRNDATRCCLTQSLQPPAQPGNLPPGCRWRTRLLRPPGWTRPTGERPRAETSDISRSVSRRAPSVLLDIAAAVAETGDSHRGYMGSGSIDLAGVFRALVKAGYKGPITLEPFLSRVVGQPLEGILGIWRNLREDGAASRFEISTRSHTNGHLL